VTDRFSTGIGHAAIENAKNLAVLQGVIRQQMFD
jgi:hypothetical protein